MGMNTGILFGEVWSSGGAVKGASVMIDWIKGDLSQPSIRVQLTETDSKSWVRIDTDSKGKYILPFFWDGTQIGLAVQTKTLTMRTVAFGAGYESDRKRVPAYLCMDLKKLLSFSIPTFDNPSQEAADCAKDFILAYRQVKAFPPHHKIILSTEVWGILAKANFFLGNA